MALELPAPVLCLVTDRRICGDDRNELVERVRRAVDGGVNMVQLREKDMPGGRLLELAQILRGVTAGRALFIVNERADVTLASEADGVQLGEDALPVQAARRLASQILVGRSVHDSQGAAEAERAGADFLVVGTIYKSPSHKGGAEAGPELIRAIKSVSGLPTLGIGGVTVENAGEVINAGASGVAVISAVLGAERPEKAAKELMAAMEKAERESTEPARTSGVRG